MPDEQNQLAEAAVEAKEVAQQIKEAAKEEPTAVPVGMVDAPPKTTEEIQAEIQRLEEVRKKAEEDAKYWRKQKAEARADYFKSRREPPEKAPEPTPDLGLGNAPKPEEFEDYNKFVEAKVAYEVNKAKTTWDRDQARKNAEAAQQEKMALLHSKVQSGFEKYSDFEEVALDPTVPITPVVGEALAECENPADVAYYLGKNRAEAIKISRMTPVQAAVALAKIDKEVATKMAENPNPKPKTISNAPPPIKPVGASHTVEKDPDKMSQREYEEWAQKRGMRRF